MLIFVLFDVYWIEYGDMLVIMECIVGYVWCVFVFVDGFIYLICV